MDNDHDEKPPIWKTYNTIFSQSGEEARITALDRFAYYERTRVAYAIVATCETALYACIILKKG